MRVIGCFCMSIFLLFFSGCLQHNSQHAGTREHIDCPSSQDNSIEFRFSLEKILGVLSAEGSTLSKLKIYDKIAPDLQRNLLIHSLMCREYRNGTIGTEDYQEYLDQLHYPAKLKQCDLRIESPADGSAIDRNSKVEVTKDGELAIDVVVRIDHRCEEKILPNEYITLFAKRVGTPYWWISK